MGLPNLGVNGEATAIEEEQQHLSSLLFYPLRRQPSLCCSAPPEMRIVNLKVRNHSHWMDLMMVPETGGAARGA